MVGLPNEKLRGLEIETFFQELVELKQLGNVTNITLAYKFKDSLENVLKVSDYRLRIQNLLKKMSLDSVVQRKKVRYFRRIEKLKKMAVLENILAKKKLGLTKSQNIDYRNMEDKKVLKAFVSFEDSETTSKLRTMINTVKLIRLLMKIKSADVV